MLNYLTTYKANICKLLSAFGRLWSRNGLKADSGADSKFVTFGTGRSSSLRKYQKMQIKGGYHILQSIRHLWLILMPNGVIARGETRSKKIDSRTWGSL